MNCAREQSGRREPFRGATSADRGKDSCFKNYILKVVSLTTETTSNIRTTMAIYNAIVAEHKECYNSRVMEFLLI